MTNVNDTQGDAPERPLESWKEIAAYVKRDVRTAKRWEKSEGLPVRRHMHESRASVYAYPSELDAWIASRQPADEPAPVPGNLFHWRSAAALLVILAATLLSAGSRPLPVAADTDNASSISVRKVWAAGDSTGAPSPDGRYLSFANWAPAELGIHDLATGKIRNVTKEGSWAKNQFAYYSIWSPDGKKIAYLWLNGDHSEVRVTGIEGAEPRVLYAHPEKGSFGIRPMAWSPDGKYIAGHLSRSDSTNQIVLLSTDSGETRALKSTEWRYPTRMSFSPDSRWLAYDAQTEQTAPERDIFLLATDGSREVTLINHPAHDYGPVWTLDGNQILFVSNRSGSEGLWVVRTAENQFGNSPQLVKSDVGRMMPMGLTTDGKLYYGYASGQNAGDVYAVALDAVLGGVIGGPKLAVQTFEGNNTSPTFAPDKKRMAYLSRRGPLGGGAWSLVIQSLDTKKEQVVKTDLGSIENPRVSSLRWSPDGRFILTAGVSAKGRRGLYRVELETGQASLVAGHGFPVDVNPCWSPDGETIYMIRLNADQKGRSLIAHRVGTGSEQVLHEAVWMTALSASADGTRLAFIQGEKEDGKSFTALKEFSLADRKSRTLFRTKSQATGFPPSTAWAEDGRSLLFTQMAREPKPNQLAGSEPLSVWRIQVAGGQPQIVNLEMEGLRNLTLAPGGGQLAFTAGRPARSEVWVMENFLPATRAPK